MSWARLDDAFPENPKVEGISDRAFRLYIAGLCHCTRNLTDGLIIPVRLKAILAATRASQRHVDELLTAGLWEQTAAGGVVVHDFLDWNPSASEVKRRRAEARDRMARSRERSQEHSQERSQNVPYGMGKKKNNASRCPECEMGGTLHTADCSRRAAG